MFAALESARHRHRHRLLLRPILKIAGPGKNPARRENLLHLPNEIDGRASRLLLNDADHGASNGAQECPRFGKELSITGPS
jgi:hypothetical protein